MLTVNISPKVLVTQNVTINCIIIIKTLNNLKIDDNTQKMYFKVAAILNILYSEKQLKDI